MNFRKGNKVDECCHAVVKAIDARRFNLARYEKPGKFHGVTVCASKPYPSVDIYDDSGNHIYHVEKRYWVDMNHYDIMVNDRKYDDLIKEDKDEFRRDRAAVIKPLLSKIRERMELNFCRLDTMCSVLNPFSLCLLDFCTKTDKEFSDPAVTGKCDGVVRLLMNKLEMYAMKCDDDGVEKLRKICRLIDEELI